MLEEAGLPAVLDLLRREVQRHKASLLILDGLSAIEETAASIRDFKKFMYELQALAAIMDFSVLKVRDAEINSALHRFGTKNAIVIEPDSSSAEQTLAQVVRQGGNPSPTVGRDGEG